MIQDSFEIYKKGNRFYLLRILNKVDFSTEVVWSRGYELSGHNDFVSIVQPLLEYLVQGFDVISEWPADEEGWHMPIKHLGLEKIIETQDLVLQYLKFQPEASEPLLLPLFSLLDRTAFKLEEKTIPTYAGSLYEVLTTYHCAKYKPKDASALVQVPFRLMFEKDYKAMEELLAAYS